MMKTIRRKKFEERPSLVTDWPKIEVPCVLPAGVTAHGIVGQAASFTVALYDGKNHVTFDADGLNQIELSLACKEALRMLQEAALGEPVGSA